MSSARRISFCLFVCALLLPATSLAVDPIRRPTVLAVGVYQGRLPNGVVDVPWWTKCSGDPVNIPRDEACFEQYAHAMPPERRVTVTVRPSDGPVTLVLMSYAPTRWNVRAVGGAVVERVILGGYYAQRVVGVAPSLAVESHTFRTATGGTAPTTDGYFFASDPQSADYPKALRRIRELTGAAPASFQGRYEGGAFIVGR